MTATPGPTPPSWKARNLSAKLEFHGVDEWHARGLKGDNVKVGIIDWGFASYNHVWNLDDLRIKGTPGVVNPNALCQPVEESIVTSPEWFTLSEACQPTVGKGVFYLLRHGTNIAELARDVAPKAEIYVAQANSPKQLKAAADWLVGKGVDVIVAANGWHYDGPGDGTSPIKGVKSRPAGDVDAHSPYRYYPSPLNTVDSVVTSAASAPVWINAAGNAEKWTFWADLESSDWVNNPASEWHGYLKFHPSKSGEKDQTCLDYPVYAKTINYQSMRWADTWNSG